MGTQVFCKTDKGRRRDSNQDSFLVNMDLGLFVIADGMGGHSGGEVASQLAVTAVEEVVQRPTKPVSPRDLMVQAFAEASRRIYDKAAYERPELLGMGTTMVLLLKAGNSIFVGNVGDSRCYLYRKPYLWQVTEDHSLVNEQLRAGILNDEQARKFESRNVITRSVGYEREVSVDILERPYTPGDVFLLCSDGLSSLVVDKQINEILNSCSVESIPEKCVDAALENGGDDNVTVMVVSL